MAKWLVAVKSKSSPTSTYIGWYRNHPEIHMLKEPMSKASLVQIHRDGNTFTVLAQTEAHSIFQPQGTKGLTIFKKTATYKSERDAKKAVTSLKKMLAKKFDKVTGRATR